MAKNIKGLMDDIIKDTDKRYSEDDGYEKFDKEGFRERLCMFVLRDIIDAMMAHDTKDLDGMIDDSIMHHIHDDYKGTCYGYLCKSRDKCKSPMLADIIQEIDEKVNEVAQECSLTKNEPVLESAEVKKMLEGVEDYDSFVEKLASEVSQKVVDDVAGLLTDGGAKAPSFSDLDDKIELKPAGAVEDTEAPANEAEPTEETPAATEEPVENPEEENKEGATEEPEVKKEEDTSAAADVAPDTASAPEALTDKAPEISATESVILTMCGNIVLESAMNGVKMPTEEGLERAIVQFCLAEMDRLFKQPSNIYDKYYNCR
jgi:hypothetical protein